MATDQIAIRVRGADEDEAREIGEALREAGATDVHEVEQEGILPIIGAVIAAAIGITVLGDFIWRMIRRGQCQQIMDFRGEDVEIEENCKRRDGSIVVVAKEGEKVEITNAPDGMDLTEVAKAALSAGADAVKAAAEAAGADASDPQPAQG